MRPAVSATGRPYWRKRARRDQEFDLVTCFEAIEHVADPFRALDELRRVLRDDGLFLVSSPNRGVYPPCNPFHLHELTMEELEAALSERFSHVRVWPQQSYGTTVVGEIAPTTETLDEEHQLAESPLSLTSLSSPAPAFVVAAASNAPLPDLHGVVMLGAAVDISAYELRIADLEQRALVAETHMGVLNTELHRIAVVRRRMWRSWRESGHPFWWMPRARRSVDVARRITAEVWGAAREQPRARASLLRGRVRQGYCEKCRHRVVFVRMDSGLADDYHCTACWSPKPRVVPR
jgi:hypothetical protein